MADLVERYVDPTAEGADNGTSWGDAWTTIESIEGEAKDLQTADEYWIVHCRGGEDALGNDYLNIDNWNPDATRYLEIVVDEGNRHDGTPGSGYWISFTGSFGLLNRIAYFRLRFIELYGDGGQDGLRPCYQLSGPASADIRIEGLLIHNFDDGILVDGAADDVYIWNTIIYDCTKTVRVIADSSVYCYNVTGVTDSTGTGFRTEDSDCLLWCKNCISYDQEGNTTHDFLQSSGTLHCENCSSSDNTADDFDADGQSGNNRVSQTFTFINEGGDDFHLHADDAGALDFGQDLSTDPESKISFSTDIKGETRSGTWDIGADEYIAAAPPAGNIVPNLIHRDFMARN